MQGLPFILGSCFRASKLFALAQILIVSTLLFGFEYNFIFFATSVSIRVPDEGSLEDVSFEEYNFLVAEGIEPVCPCQQSGHKIQTYSNLTLVRFPLINRWLSLDDLKASAQAE